jgi:hypothetical protein
LKGTKWKSPQSPICLRLPKVVTKPDEVRVSPDGTAKFYRKRKRIYPSEEWLKANLGKK